MAAAWFVNILVGYAVLGLLFSIVFISVGVSRVDPIAKGSSIGFRIVILPGVAALWPLLLRRWLKKGERS